MLHYKLNVRTATSRPASGQSALTTPCSFQLPKPFPSSDSQVADMKRRTTGLESLEIRILQLFSSTDSMLPHGVAAQHRTIARRISPISDVRTRSAVNLIRFFGGKQMPEPCNFRSCCAAAAMFYLCLCVNKMKKKGHIFHNFRLLLILMPVVCSEQ